MKRFVFALAIAAISLPAAGWNLPAKNINALRFEKSGQMRFTLFDSGNSGDEFKCSTGSGGQWFVVSACSATEAVCLAATNRMASMMLTAKLAGTRVHVQRAGCNVTEVALKP